MIKLTPQFVNKKGKKEFVILPYREFVELQKLLDDMEDLLDLRKARQKEKDAPTISLENAKKQLLVNS